MVRQASAEFLAAIRSSPQTRIARVTVLDALLNPVEGGALSGLDGRFLDGTITMDRRRDVRRTAQLRLANPEGMLTPTGPGSLAYWDRLIRVGRGLVLRGGEEEVPTVGTFIIDSVTVDSGPGRSTLSIAGADQVDRLLRSKFTAPTTYASGARVRDVVSGLAVAAGADPNHLSLDDGGATLGAARTYEIGEERLASLRELVVSFALEFYADPDGRMVLAPVRSVDQLPTVWTFAAGVEAIMLGVSKRWSKDRLYNHVLVKGEAADMTPIYAEASDSNPASPTYINGPLGDRLYTYTSSMIRTQAQADAVAVALLYEHALIEEEIVLPHSPNPILEPGDAVEVVHATTGTSDRYIIDELTLPLAEGESRLVVRKLRRLL